MGNELLRHAVATIKYRFQTVILNHGESFGDFNLGKGSRSPIEIIHHMSQVMEWSSSMILEIELKSTKREVQNFEEETKRFLKSLKTLDKSLSQQPISMEFTKKLIQGPLADVLTHIGQIAMLSRLDGNPVIGQNYAKAEIQIPK